MEVTRQAIDVPRSRTLARLPAHAETPDPGRRTQKNRRPRLRTSGVAPVVPPHFAAPFARAASAARPGSSAEVHRTMHRPVNGGRSTLAGHPSPPTAPGRSRAVRSAAPRSSRLACSVPLRSCRGSLARPGARLPVLIVADSVFTCPLTLASARWSVNPSVWPEIKLSVQRGRRPPRRSRPQSCCHQPEPP